MLKKTISYHRDQGERLFFANGIPLYFGNVSHSKIRALGKGRCSHWESNLMFSLHNNENYLPCWPIIQSCPANTSTPHEVRQHEPVSVNAPDSLANAIDALVAYDKNTLRKAPPTHLLFITHALSSGGAERQWCYLAAEASRRGYKVSLLTFSLSGANRHYLPLLTGLSINVHALDNLLLVSSEIPAVPVALEPSRILELALAINMLRPSHVLCQLDQPNIWGGTASLLAPSGVQKILLSFRNLNPSHFPYLYEPDMLECYKSLIASDRVELCGNSIAGNDDYASWLGISPERIKFIPNALVPDKLVASDTKESLREKFSIPEDALVLLGVFRLSEEKNPLLFLEVVSKVKETYPDVVVLHAGSGHFTEPVYNAAKTLGLRKNIRFMGARSDIPDLMTVADIMLLCSNQEGISNALLEAQYMQLPIVATSAGGTPEAVIDGETALLAPPGDIDVLTAHCLTLAQSPEMRKVVGEAGKNHVIQNFSIQKLGDRTLDALGLSRQADMPLLNPIKGE